MKQNLILVCGAGGFIGGRLIADLLRHGHTSIRAVDLKPLDRWYQRFEAVENLQLDLKDLAACRKAVSGENTFKWFGPRSRKGSTTPYGAIQRSQSSAKPNKEWFGGSINFRGRQNDDS